MTKVEIIRRGEREIRSRDGRMLLRSSAKRLWRGRGLGYQNTLDRLNLRQRLFSKTTNQKMVVSCVVLRHLKVSGFFPTNFFPKKTTQHTQKGRSLKSGCPLYTRITWPRWARPTLQNPILCVVARLADLHRLLENRALLCPFATFVNKFILKIASQKCKMNGLCFRWRHTSIDRKRPIPARKRTFSMGPVLCCWYT